MEFPWGHIEDNETLKESIKRELAEEIGLTENFNPIITNYYDKMKKMEIDFIINVDSSKVNVKLSDEHSDYK